MVLKKKKKRRIAVFTAGIMAFTCKRLPTFDELPLGKDDPPYSAWGLWEDTTLGSLNYLSDEVVLKTIREEIQTGMRIGLKCVLKSAQ